MQMEMFLAKRMARRLIQPINAVLIDLSGTIHIDNKATPGAVEALHKLRSSGLKIKFVTNTTKENVGSLHKRLTGLGFDIQQDEIFSSLIAARDLIRKLNVRPFMLLSEQATIDFEEFDTSNPNAVLIGLSPSHFNYSDLNKAFQLILKGYPFIAIHKARYYKTNDGLALGPGPFVHGLEYATDKKAIVVGKPEKNFFLTAAESVYCEPQSCVMIGDDVRDDIIGALHCGMQGILVKTGKYRQGDEEELSQEHALISDTFAHAVNMLLREINRG